MKSNSSVPTTVDEYLAEVPEPAHSTLKKVRSMIRSAVPAEATEVISYRIPMFMYKGMVMGFAAFANHCSLFPGPVPIEAMQDELKGYVISKGTIRFAIDKASPAALVKKLVKIRIAQNELSQNELRKKR